MRSGFTALFVFTASVFIFDEAVLFRGTAAGQRSEGPTYRFDKIAQGVFLAVPAAPASAAANIPVIVSEQDAIVVGTHFSPGSARALIEQLKAVTDKPVRFIVNTHYHAAQLSAPREAFPDGVEVIGHELARRAMLFDASGRPRPASGIAPPTLGMTTRLAFYRGDREIRILYVGRGHSDNDIVVLLPKERIVCTGDLLTGTLPDMSDGNITEWVSTLEAMKVLDFDTVLPARGAPFKGKDKIAAWQSYLRDVLSQTTGLLNNGVSAEEAAKRVDLTSHRTDFPEITGPGVALAAVKRLQTQIELEPAFAP
jgi:glyoxylase-like metal-dependent hydrolase (beta-lactamase superfamily II)